ncbi:unnamed protein product [Blepharisma stoltei]|uniref:Uncharacterized protein n=1 Tax=Blepharisma stoltei TaxID=1481888 RepID=A0AAU9K297_9CILI|nr:unnamed protein product [Blepharisma stoltei]
MLDTNNFAFLLESEVKGRLRTSTASTADSSDNSHWNLESFEAHYTHEIEPSYDFSNSTNWLQLMNPSDALALFTPMTKEQDEHYCALKPRVEKVLELLNSTLTTISVKDDCSSQPSSVKLAMPGNSRLLNRRRALTIV